MRRLVFSLLPVALVLFAASASSQDAPPQAAPPQAAPSREAPSQPAPPALVGRVSFVSGQLAFHMAGETQWSAAKVNYPVAAGASFWTAPQSRAEFRIGPQTLALSGNTAVEIVQLDHQVMRLAVTQGRINLHLRELGDGNSAEVEVPRGAVKLLQPGIYDIDAGSQDHPARIAVFEGSARFVGGSLDVAVKAGDVAVIGGTDTLTASLERAAPDKFAEWCRARDYDQRRLAAAPRRVSPRMTGYEALDAHGTWRSVAQYGEVWVPNAVPPRWAPYRYGHWAWVQPWGWTWVDAEPWGFAPSHYGRWAYVEDLWAWVPGPLLPQPVYAPALVAFIDDPAVVLASRVRAPLVGWVPLGPGEPYWPGYTSDAAHIRALNAGITGDVAALDRAALALANRGAATVVPQRAFAKAERISRAALRVSERGLRQAKAAAAPPGLGLGRAARGKAGREAAALPGPGAGRERFAGRPGRDAAAARAAPRIGKADKGQGSGAVPAAAAKGGGPKHFAGPDKAQRGGGPQEARKGGGPKQFGGGPQEARKGGKGGKGGPKQFGGGPQEARKGGKGGPKQFGGGKGPGGGPQFGAGGGGGGKGGGGKGK